jgi:hypothetical protein
MIDSLNDTHIDTFELRQPDALSCSPDITDYNGFNVSSNGGDDGQVILFASGGTPPYKWVWSDGYQQHKRTNMSAGTYSFTISDANQCSTTGNVTLVAPSPLQYSFSNIQNPTCFGSEDGSVQLNISGGIGDYKVSWDNGGFELNPTDLIAGYNEVRIYDNGRLVIDTGIVLTEPPPVTANIVLSDYNGFNVSCVDCFNGTINTNVTGGTAPYVFEWKDDPNITGPNRSNLNGGIYTLTINDANGCQPKRETIIALTMPNPKDWSRQGNANIDPNDFIGSSDASDVVFKTNNQDALRLMGNGNLALPNYSGAELLSVDANGILQKIDDLKEESTRPRPSDCDPTVSWAPGTIITPTWTASPGKMVTCPNVGIGTLNPLHALDISGGLNTNYIYMFNQPAFGAVGAGSNLLNIYTEANNFGIGTSTPQYKLDVVGSINANSFFKDGIEMRGSQWSEATNSANNICYNSGNVGIGHCNPDYLLHLKGSTTNIMLENTDASGTNIPNKFLLSSANGAARLMSDHGFIFFIDSDNNDPDNSNKEYFRIAKNSDQDNSSLVDLFFINGEGTGFIRELYVQEPLDNDNKYPDYVFDDKYNLMSLKDFSKFIKKEKHLPNIPTAIDFKKENKGLAVSDMLLKLLRTQEEQALYIVQLHEQNELLKKQVELLLKK